MNVYKLTYLFFAATIIGCLQSHAGPFTNGGFEIINHAPLATNEGTVINPGDTWLVGWTVGGPGSDVFVNLGSQPGSQGTFNPVDGKQFINFNGNNSMPGGSLSQTFTTTVGGSYSVSFWVGETGSGNVSLTATALNGIGTVIASNVCLPTANNWIEFYLNFTALTTNTTLVFLDSSTQTTAVDVTLDAVTVTSNGIPTCDPPPSGLVGWWRAEGDVLDELGGNNGALAGNVSYSPGKVGSAFAFGGVEAAVMLGFATNLQLQNFTIESWIRRSTNTVVTLDPRGDACLFAYGLGGYAFFLHGPSGYLALGDIGYDNITSTATVTDTNWHHVAVTKSGGSVVFYLDSVAYPVASYNTTFTFTTSAAIGARGDDLSASFFGLIDEMAIYNRALLAPEITNIFKAGAAGKCLALCIPHSALATAIVTNGFVIGATITDGGCGYTNNPIVLIQNGGGTGATATAVVSNGIVVGIHITDAGINYTSSPTIFVYSPLGWQVGLIKAVIPTFTNLLIGTNYQLQTSLDLSSWMNQGTPFTATNPVMIYPQYFDVANWNELYFRLEVIP